MTTYIEFTSPSPPSQIGEDADGRAMFSFNISALIDGSSPRFDEEIAQIIHNEGLGVLGTDLWIGRSVVIPDGSGPFTLVIADGGVFTLESHDNSRIERPVAMISTRGSSYSSTRSRAYNQWRLFDGVRGVSIAV